MPVGKLNNQISQSTTSQDVQTQKQLPADEKTAKIVKLYWLPSLSPTHKLDKTSNLYSDFQKLIKEEGTIPMYPWPENAIRTMAIGGEIATPALVVIEEEIGNERVFKVSQEAEDSIQRIKQAADKVRKEDIEIHYIKDELTIILRNMTIKTFSFKEIDSSKISEYCKAEAQRIQKNQKVTATEKSNEISSPKTPLLSDLD